MGQDKKGRKTINFGVLHERPPRKGLRVELRAVTPETSLENSIWVSEDAFGFLEPSIKAHCAHYGQWSHWGVTEVGLEEWKAILADWDEIARHLEAAEDPEEYTRPIWFFDDETEHEFKGNFRALKQDLIRFVRALSAWASTALRQGTPVVIRGI